MNKVLLVGRIANDIRSFTTQSGVNYSRTNIAISRRSTSTDPITDFIPVVAWRGNADFMSRYLTKGSLVSIEGSISTSSFKNAAGENVRVVEVTIDYIASLESRQQRENRINNNGNTNYSFKNANTNSSISKFSGSEENENEFSFTPNNENTINSLDSKHKMGFDDLD
ncbi:single-stranded DNA-binding protein [Mycoplasmopsis phocirhinis]|uniref:Single-stranded DNA-binding protein n=1 Tax=Mycoplasmopsis phocirhinis TaxID=142650 RepID=A0A4P6MNE1_9BACT|nr:single-stranded DNA-binding protein [Mycoplasmopsis phocirhinis]QBF34513.1 single-stranded DNA-binding protein [Mycoplasmopsis phocirhinis]